MHILFLFCVSALLSLLLTPVCRNLFARRGLVDRPDGRRKLHRHPIPRLGGVPIVLAYVLASALLLLTGRLLPTGASLMWPLVPAVSIVFFTGLADDLVGLKPWEKLFGQVAAAILEILAGCDLGGFGVVRFDIPMLAEEFARAGFEFNPDNRRIVDAQRIYHKKEPRDLSAALTFYCGEMHLGAHGAEADALATVAVLEAQLQKYTDLPRSLDELDNYCNPPRNPAWADRTGKLKWQNGELLINFGVQNIGRNLKDLVRDNPKFLKWILKSDFPADTKRIVADALEGRFLTPPAVKDDGLSRRSGDAKTEGQTTDDR